ncbi:universal stress protein [Hoeflea sp. TYP-13]|uniref:universal stress protein n=1 Tax=Hoeflea sp. TYP-13 TaxID=3230023 RepID=UPI0034C65177
MSIKRILLPVSNQDDVTQIADFAFTLAGHHKAEVQGVFPQHSVWTDEWLDNWGLPEGEIEALEMQSKKNAQEAELGAQKIFEDHAKRHEKVPAKFLPTFDMSTKSLLDYAIYADVAVLGHISSPQSKYMRFLANQMLTQSTRPVIIAPSRPVPKNLGNRVVVAWKHGQEASRAVAAALPLIEKADDVVIVSVGGSKDRNSLDDLGSYVSLHAKNVDIAVLDPKGQKTGHLLVEKTAEKSGSILVMGAFSHRRWREQVFGGVTDYVLHNTDVPVLMMH